MAVSNSAKLKGKVALVTGGSRGIGKAIVEKLVLDGIDFIGIHYAGNSEGAIEAVKFAQKQGVQACALQADFIDNARKSSNHLWQQFHEELKLRGYAEFDILVNCAGIAPLATLASTDENLYNSVVSINLEAPFFLIQAASPYIKEGGRIINLSSVLTRIAAPTRAIYAASKGAINSLTLALASDFGHRKITVNAVSPGVIDTDMNSEWINEGDAREVASQFSVFSRIGNPDDVAAVVAFLASNDSCWVTGQIIDVSGGSCI